MHETFFQVLGLIGLLTIASLLLPLANRINFPFTVLLAAAGAVLGVVVLSLGHVEGLWIVGDFLGALDEVDITSEVVFFVFLPALIFESAVNINVRHLMADIGPILLLAIIGLLISTVAVGTSVWWVTGMLPVACLLLGAIVSATDPVAVIAIFKNLGAPKRLTILVEGESLFNDATAIVAFTILSAILVGGSEFHVTSAALDFIRVFFGGILVGLAISWAVAHVIGRLRNMPLVEITLTICLAYVAFLMAEHYLHVSGVMAVVTAGLVIGSFGRTQVSPETWHALKETWEELGFWANSLIFFLVGLLVPKVLADFSTTEAIALPVVIVAAFAARAAVLYGVLPAMNALGLGQRASFAYRTVMMWGGLRGAVSLALALVILENPAIDPQVQKFVAVLVTGFVLFTLFVNAPTMGKVLAFFGLDQLSPLDRALRNRAMALALAEIRDGVGRAAKDNEIDPAVADGIINEYDGRLQSVEARMEGSGTLSEGDLQRVALTTLVNRERQLHLERFEQGLTASAITRMLLANTDRLLDASKSRGAAGYRRAVQRNLGFGPEYRLATILQRRFGHGELLALLLARRLEVLRASRTVVNQLIAYARDTIGPMIGEAIAGELVALLEERLEGIKERQRRMRMQYPEHARKVQERYLARVAQRLEDANYRNMLDEQVIGPEVFNDLMRDLDARARAVAKLPALDLGLEPEKLVAKVPLFADLPAERIEEITRLLKPVLVIPEERVVKKGETGDAMYFIASGRVQVAVEPEPVELGPGAFFGEIALVTDRPRVADVTATGYCHLLALYARDFRGLLRSHPELRANIDQVARERLGVALAEQPQGA